MIEIPFGQAKTLFEFIEENDPGDHILDEVWCMINDVWEYEDQEEVEFISIDENDAKYIYSAVDSAIAYMEERGKPIVDRSPLLCLEELIKN